MLVQFRNNHFGFKKFLWQPNWLSSAFFLSNYFQIGQHVVLLHIQKFVQSILELLAIEEIHVEDRRKVWPEPGFYPVKGICSRGFPIGLAGCGIWHFFDVICDSTQNSQQSCAKTATSSDINLTRQMQETYKNVCSQTYSFLEVKLYGVSEEKHTITNMISVIRINILLYLQTVLIKKTGPGVTI